MTSCQGIQKVYKKNIYTLCTPGCTSLYPLSFNTKYVHPLYAQKGRECTWFHGLIQDNYFQVRIVNNFISPFITLSRRFYFPDSTGTADSKGFVPSLAVWMLGLAPFSNRWRAVVAFDPIIDQSSITPIDNRPTKRRWDGAGKRFCVFPSLAKSNTTYFLAILSFRGKKWKQYCSSNANGLLCHR
jgi:hypothetical protein